MAVNMETENAMMWAGWARRRGLDLTKVVQMWMKLGLTEIPPFDRGEAIVGEAPGKGLQGQHCNRTACQLPNSAHWQHKDNGAFYCMNCAWDINEYALRIHKMDLFPGLTAEITRLGMEYRP
jgi:hypothetical protein